MVSFNAVETSAHQFVCYQFFYLDEGQIQPLFLSCRPVLFWQWSCTDFTDLGEPSQVTAPWGCCHAPRTRRKGHSECWQFLRSSTCCLQTQPRHSPTFWGKTHCPAVSPSMILTGLCQQLVLVREGCSAPWPAAFPAFPSSLGVMGHPAPPTAAVIHCLAGSEPLGGCVHWGLFYICPEGSLVKSNIWTMSVLHGYFWRLSLLSVIFLQKTFARWLYMAVVLLRAKWRPHAGAP